MVATAMAKSRVGGITDDLNLIMKGRSSSELLYYYENRHVVCSPIFDFPSNIPTAGFAKHENMGERCGSACRCPISIPRPVMKSRRKTTPGS